MSVKRNRLWGRALWDPRYCDVKHLEKTAACVQTPHGQVDEQPMGCQRDSLVYVALQIRQGKTIALLCEDGWGDKNSAFLGLARASEHIVPSPVFGLPFLFSH